MKIRFVLDESTWEAAAMNSERLAEALENLANRWETAANRKELITKHPDFYRTSLGGGVELFSLLFDPDCRLFPGRDLANRLFTVLDQMEPWSDDQLVSYDAHFQGATQFAPGVAFAHERCSQGHAVAVMPLPLAMDTWGQIDVTVADRTLELHFVATEQEHRAFFRDAVTVEKMDESAFEAIAGSAFPALAWADDVWKGLKKLSEPFVSINKDLVCCLGNLDDHGAATFFEYQEKDPRQLARVLSAKVEFETSDENGATKKDPHKEADRTRSYRGKPLAFWWHAKLKPHIDRIHFRYLPNHEKHSEPGTLVIGIFQDHCL